MSNDSMNELPSPSLPLAPICDDHLIWEIALSRYHLPALTVPARLAFFPFLLNLQLPLRRWPQVFRWGHAAQKCCWVS